MDVTRGWIERICSVGVGGTAEAATPVMPVTLPRPCCEGARLVTAESAFLAPGAMVCDEFCVPLLRGRLAWASPVPRRSRRSRRDRLPDSAIDDVETAVVTGAPPAPRAGAVLATPAAMRTVRNGACCTGVCGADLLCRGTCAGFSCDAKRALQCCPAGALYALVEGGDDGACARTASGCTADELRLVVAVVRLFTPPVGAAAGITVAAGACCS